jgi:hypothetical protein
MDQFVAYGIKQYVPSASELARWELKLIWSPELHNSPQLVKSD